MKVFGLKLLFNDTFIVIMDLNLCPSQSFGQMGPGYKGDKIHMTNLVKLKSKEAEVGLMPPFLKHQGPLFET